jgi:DNA-binding MarR family transcriptional regulator
VPTARALTEPRISYVIARLERALRRELSTRIQPTGLTLPQYAALSVLRARRGLSNAQLARRSYITPQTMSEVIAALVERGLVKRAPDPNHGRILRIEVTGKGHRLLAQCDEAVDELEQDVLAELSEAERAQFLDALRSCVHRLGAGLP